MTKVRQYLYADTSQGIKWTELIIGEYSKGDGEHTVDFVKKIMEKNPQQRIIIFGDGAAYHKGELMREFLSQVNGDLPREEWQVTCHLLAPYAPEENPIEAVWLQLKQLIRRFTNAPCKLKYNE